MQPYTEDILFKKKGTLMKKVIFILALCALLFPVSGQTQPQYSVRDVPVFGSQGDFAHQINIPASVTNDEINATLAELFKALSIYSSWGSVDIRHVDNVIGRASKNLQPALMNSFDALRRNLTPNGPLSTSAISVPNLRIALVVPLEAELMRRQREALGN